MKLFKVVWCLLFGHDIARIKKPNYEWFALDGKPTTTITGTINALSLIDFAAGEAVSGDKFVYEIIKA